MSGKGKGTAKTTVCRSSETGRFVSEKFAKTHPKTTQKETVKK
ncbi:MAG: hypothetical protein PHW83_13255 [Bacteroidales bacterium]|nr:hypothetical protein [Bacteroidales bacterium]